MELSAHDIYSTAHLIENNSTDASSPHYIKYICVWHNNIQYPMITANHSLQQMNEVEHGMEFHNIIKCSYNRILHTNALIGLGLFSI